MLAPLAEVYGGQQSVTERLSLAGHVRVSVPDQTHLEHQTGANARVSIVDSDSVLCVTTVLCMSETYEALKNLITLPNSVTTCKTADQKIDRRTDR